jgi:outer membrane lipase/esterase
MCRLRYNFAAGPFTHGPLAEMLLQQVHINGYTETDAFGAIGGFTALSFSGQTRNSAVGELGYQASVDVGIWSPFAKIAWDHEFAATDRSVAASLTTISAPSYSMPAVLLGTDWATASVGTSVRLGHGITGYAMFFERGRPGERGLLRRAARRQCRLECVDQVGQSILIVRPARNT